MWGAFKLKRGMKNLTLIMKLTDYFSDVPLGIGVFFIDHINVLIVEGNVQSP